MCDVHVDSLVEIDEAGRRKCDCNPIRGSALKGVKYRLDCETRGQMVKHSCSGYNFESGLNISCFLLCIANTGRRVIIMDRHDAHFGDVVTLIESHGHIVVFRPVHSPDFGPVAI